MPAYNFQKQFKPSIMSGRKISTIRAKRKGAVGAPIRLWITEGIVHDEYLGEANLTTVKQINLKADFETDELQICLETPIGAHRSWLAVLNSDDALTVAINEGFESLEAMKLWFRTNQRLPFNGYLHTWDKLK